MKRISENTLRKYYYHRNKPAYDKLKTIIMARIIEDGDELGDLDSWEMEL